MMFWLVCTAAAEDVARVLLVEQGVSVVHQGVERPTKRLEYLDRADVLRTDASGSVILQLFNDHLIRIDSEIELPLSSLAMLNGVRSSAPVAVQLDSLLYPDESRGFGGMVEATEAMGGWHSRLAAVYAPVRGYGSADDSPTPAASPPLGVGPKIRIASTVESGKAPENPRPLAALLGPFQSGQSGFDTCILPWARSIGLEKLTNTLVLHTASSPNGVVRVWSEGHLPLPPCLRDAVVGHTTTSNQATLKIPNPE